MKRHIHCLALLMCFPLFAQAAAYKCKQPDGTLTYQDTPCPAGAEGSKIALPPPRPNIDTGQANEEYLLENDLNRQRAAAAAKARIDQVNAYNKSVRCNNARRQLGVLKEQRAVYTRDDNGDRRYVSDDYRAAWIAAAEQRAAVECR